MTYRLVIIGGQFGDEGKGKIISSLARKADIVARWSGGNNAGHTVVIDGKAYFVHLLPSGVFYSNVVNIMGRGMVIDPLQLNKELTNVKENGFNPNLMIAPEAHVITDLHRIFDAGYERRLGKGQIGTTGRGIGPCSQSKANRKEAIRIEDLVNNGLRDKFLDITRGLAAQIVEMHPHFEIFQDLSMRNILNPKGNFEDALEAYALSQAAIYSEAGQKIEKYISDGIIYKINDDNHKFILCEGAQGIMLHPDQGTFPFVTSTDTGVGGCISHLGLAPQKIDDVIAVVKAYETRVGGGPFATEQDNEIGDKLREAGVEYGTTTGRPRRCGWLNEIGLKNVVLQQGASWIALTKLDVLDGMDEIYTGHDTGFLENPGIKYKKHKGWKKSIRDCRHFDELPQKAKDYVMEINKFAPVAIVSVGPGEEETIYMPDFIKRMRDHGIDLKNR